MELLIKESKKSILIKKSKQLSLKYSKDIMMRDRKRPNKMSKIKRQLSIKEPQDRRQLNKLEKNDELFTIKFYLFFIF